jgi:SM-20-related protein
MSAAAMFSAAEIIVQDQFLSASEVRSLLECMHVRQAQGDFFPARIGKRSLQRRETIRGDFTCWLHEPLYPAERLLLEQLEQLRLKLNREQFLGLFELELHYARYPPGAEYARHLDQPRGTTQRKVSLVLYLNLDWQPTAGGELRIFDASAGYRDIAPIAGRLVCFLTAGREHAVLPAQRERLSISGWFRVRD